MHKIGLVIGILILLVGVNIGGVFAGNVDVKTISSVGFDGNTLYVGGTGPNNYTKIQDAIDNASDGDTVYVYNGTYNENINITKSIFIKGEDKETTLINANDNSHVIKINKDYVNLNNFYIYGNNGISLNSDYNVISNNIFDIEENSIECESLQSNNNEISSNEFRGSELRQRYAIRLWMSNYNYINNNYVNSYLENGFYILGDDNVISENLFLYDNEENPYELEFGDIVINGNFNEIINNNLTLMMTKSFISAITLIYGSSNNIIKGNTISDNGIDDYVDGIELYNNCENNVITNNKIYSGGIGIRDYSCNNEIINNLIKDCFLGVLITEHSTKNSISNNNFLNNNKNAMFIYHSFFNTWDGNYWDEPREFLYLIFGYISPSLYWFAIWDLLFETLPPTPLIRIDWNPAQEPYDI